MKHLVLGSSGLVGRYLCNFISSKNEEVLYFDIQNNTSQDCRFGLQNEELHQLLKNCDFVHFLAFDVGGSKYLLKQNNSYEYIQNNVLIMHNVFELLKLYEKPFIFISTQLITKPDTPYGALKILGEHYTKSLNGKFVRLWNVYGEEIFDDEKNHVVHDFVVNALNDKKITLLSTGEEYKQFLHCSDCAECLYKISKLYDSIPNSAPLHISSFEWIKVIDLAKMIAEIINEPIEIIPGSRDTSVPILNPNAFILDYWQPNISLKQGISGIVDKYTHILNKERK